MNDLISMLNGLGQLATPATTLIEKIAGAMNWMAEPHQRKRLAKADAKAERIRAESDIEVADLYRRTGRRWMGEEVMRQKNIESVITKALPLLSSGADPKSVHDDWIVLLLQHARLISDEKVQEWWSRILADEANAPGSFSRKTLNILADIGRSDAEMFRQICGFSCEIEGSHLLLFDEADEVYTDNGVTSERLRHAQDLGLLSYGEDPIFGHPGYCLTDVPEILTATYFGERLRVRSRSADGKDVPIGRVIFTRAGKEVASIAGGRKVNGFWDYVKEQWVSHIVDDSGS